MEWCLGSSKLGAHLPTLIEWIVALFHVTVHRNPGLWWGSRAPPLPPTPSFPIGFALPLTPTVTVPLLLPLVSYEPRIRAYVVKVVHLRRGFGMLVGI